MSKHLFFAAFIAAFSLSFCFAQTKTETNTANSSAAMDAQVELLVKTINEVSKMGSTEPLMRLFSTNFSGHITIFDIDGKTRGEDRSYGSMQRFYNRYTQPQVRADYRLTRILKSYATDSLGFVVFELEYDMYNNGKIYKVGEQTLSLQAVKRNNQWLFEDGVTFIRYKQLNKAVCECQLYTKGSDYIATLQVPQGEDYVKRFYNIRFAPQATNQKEIWFDGSLYVWTLDETNTIVTPDKRKLTTKTKNEAEAINVIINDVHKDQCFNVVFQQ